MPLEAGKSREAFSHNVATEMKEGHKPQSQAVAIAYAEKRRTDSTPRDPIESYMDAASRGDADGMKGAFRK